ncbi:uncharacterized protein K452DRAFT_286984 [Aplosporella prunicola CBS 121167]|uniref:Mitochondrial export translocase Oxa2 n=1 Tax=Aplosporella prunicola CBS 121167 TaxID=1176127 RepID=A0A6A6BEH3_9PEZI|nr:uncharacterized protein K452DRAFT_286984 [Aplosporella prunicola CBS 121167]KAF2142559.1 hypothetical protein K452DRAFT_286984 [Aplosporella prunicola CBS 121167]
MRPPPLLLRRQLLLRPSPLSRRSFHATPARRHAGAVLDVICAPPHLLLDSLHAAGVSWAYAIPVSALVMRGLFIFPFFYLPARTAQLRLVSTVPLKRAAAAHAGATTEAELLQKGPRQAKTAAQNAMRQHSMVIDKRWRCQLWKRMLPLTSLPIFLTLAETIRRMAGSGKGFLGMLLEWIWGPETGQTETAAAAAPGTDAVVDAGTSLVQQVAQSPWLEPSLATEGALWFPNLMAADPTMALPALVSGATLFTLWHSSKRIGPASQAVPKKGRSETLRKVLMSGSLAIFPLTLKVPAAIMIYWFSSTVLAFAGNVLLDKMYPLKMPPESCKRRIKPKRVMVDVRKPEAKGA